MKITDVTPLDISSVLGKVKNKISLAGVELEGGWTELPPGVSHLERDGSVFHDNPPKGAGINYYGELVIRPTVPGSIARLIRDNHPDVVDASCGLHVHMSFDNLWRYHLLMVPEYPATVVEYLKRWSKDSGLADDHYIWPRLAGKSEYCKLEFTADAQVRHTRKSHDRNMSGNRYTAIHYCGRLRTIECRLLPMMKSRSESIRAVRQVMDITNACLFELGRKYKRYKKGEIVSLPNNATYEETIVDIV